MSKGHDEKHKEPGTAKEATGEVKKPTEAKKPEAPRAAKGKGHDPLADGCHAWGCKAKAAQFNFCSEHYDHFKFGLIKKTGEPVSDYEKKFEHFLAHKSKKGSQRVA